MIGLNYREMQLLKVMDAGPTRINVRATGDAVRVIPKTEALGVITNVDVFAVPIEVSLNVK